jgi:hypothetical protein
MQRQNWEEVIHHIRHLPWLQAMPQKSDGFSECFRPSGSARLPAGRRAGYLVDHEQISSGAGLCVRSRIGCGVVADANVGACNCECELRRCKPRCPPGAAAVTWTNSLGKWKSWRGVNMVVGVSHVDSLHMKFC